MHSFPNFNPKDGQVNYAECEVAPTLEQITSGLKLDATA